MIERGRNASAFLLWMLSRCTMRRIKKRKPKKAKSMPPYAIKSRLIHSIKRDFTILFELLRRLFILFYKFIQRRTADG